MFYYIMWLKATRNKQIMWFQLTVIFSACSPFASKSINDLFQRFIVIKEVVMVDISQCKPLNEDKISQTYNSYGTVIKY